MKLTLVLAVPLLFGAALLAQQQNEDDRKIDKELILEDSERAAACAKK